MANLVWKDLTVSVGKDGDTKTILKGVSGCVGSKHMLAIMGPSGSGKTTLLDTMAGRISPDVTVKGDVLLNGHRTTLSYGLAAYVSQDDLLIGTLTVKETLMFVARLRLSGAGRQEMASRVDEVMLELGLQDVADVHIGNWHMKGVSGGQRRRVSIGCELITSPTLLFLDEPTSGLDAASSFYVMRGMSTMAGKGRTIISVIHQPSSEVFELFDKLCLLSRGSIVYFGEAARAIDLFQFAGLPCAQHRNPADHFLQCTNSDFMEVESEKFATMEEQIDTLEKVFRSSEFAQLLDRDCDELSSQKEKCALHTKGAGFLSQVAALTHRSFLNNMRDLGMFWMRLGMYVALCVCIGTIYFDLDKSWAAVNSRAAMLFFVVAFLTFMSISAFPSFVEDMQIFQKERLNGYYGVAAFVLSNTIASAPFIFLISLTSSICAYWLAGLHGDAERFVYFVLDLYLSLSTVEGLMMAISSVVPHYLMGIAGGAGMMGLYMLVCGFFQPREELPDPVWRYPLHYISFHSYAFTGFMNNEFADTDGWDSPATLLLGNQMCQGSGCKITGEEVLKAWSVEVRDKWQEIAILVAMAVFYRFVFFAVLKLKERKVKL
ncbi:hypothetical protein BSKO_09509 [Bryopsis sp. KO-2023]|nr:hypothetical protein BSKO_09509 [Bryopsis sp. KO-2023]